MASVVRETPRINASSDPTAATTAPARTTGVSQPAPAASTTSDNGAVAVANPSAPSVTSAATPTSVYTTTVIAKAIGTARGMVRAGSRTSSPRVAIRAYPANAKNSNPAAPSTSTTEPTSPPSREGTGAPPTHPVTTTVASTARVVATRNLVAPAVVRTPRRLTTVTATAAATAISRAYAGNR